MKTDRYWIEQQDNLEFMKLIPDNKIDLIYCDILYGTGRRFSDYQDLKPKKEIIDEFYIPRIKGMKRVLKDTGSIYLQMDTKINHWIRLILDDVFGYDRMLNELIWCYRSQGFNKNKWSEKHDVILLYSKSKNWLFNLESVRESEISESTQKRYHKEIAEYGMTPTTKNGKIYWNNPYSPPRDWFIINTLPQAHKERLSYDTQKPKALIERIIKASSNENDIVADFFMGSGTAGEVALELNRKFIGCDIGERAFDITKKRLENYKTKETIDSIKE